MNETLIKEKENVKQQVVSKCCNCGDVEDLLPLNEHEHEFGNEIEKHSGVLCGKCKCFHYLDEEGNVTYEYNYRDILVSGDDVKWNISDN